MFDAILYLAAGLISFFLLCLSMGASKKSKIPDQVGIPQTSEERARMTGIHDFLLPLPGGTPEDEALLYYDMACFDSKYGHLAKARQRLKKAFQISPRFREIAARDPELEPLWRDTHPGV